MAEQDQRGVRVARTETINNAFEKNGNTWEIADINKPIFQEFRKKHQKKYAKTGDNGKPRMYFAEKFNGGYVCLCLLCARPCLTECCCLGRNGGLASGWWGDLVGVVGHLLIAASAIQKACSRGCCSSEAHQCGCHEGVER